MALTINPATKEVSIPQADLTFVSGTLYDFNTTQFMRDLNALLDDENYIWMDDAFSHNTEVTILGVTYARFIEMINGWNITFENTGAAYSVRFNGSNNNMFDLESGVLNATPLVTAIGNNSAGLINTPDVTALHGQVERSIYIDTAAATNGNGYQQSPYNNFTDAVDDAEASGIFRLVLLNDATVDRQLRNFKFVGIGNPTLSFNGQDVDRSRFEDLQLDGTAVAANGITATECTLKTGVAGLEGFFDRCGLGGTVTLATASSTVFLDCYSAIGGTTAPTLDINGGAANVSVRGYKGGLQVTGSTDAGSATTIGADHGNITLQAGNTAGTIVVRGLARLTDSSAGATVNIDGLAEPDDLRQARKILKNRNQVNPSTNAMEIYDDAGTSVEQSANIYKDVAGAQPWDGTGDIIRRDKLT